MTQEYIEQSMTTVPNSLKSQLDRAQNLLAQSERADATGDHSLALVKAKEGMRVLKALASVAPNNATLLIAAEMGYRGYEFEVIERVDRSEIVEQKFLGITIGHEVVNVPTITRRVTRGRLF